MLGAPLRPLLRPVCIAVVSRPFAVTPQRAGRRLPAHKAEAAGAGAVVWLGCEGQHNTLRTGCGQGPAAADKQTDNGIQNQTMCSMSTRPEPTSLQPITAGQKFKGALHLVT